MKSVFAVYVFSLYSLLSTVECGKARRHRFRDKRQILGDFIAARTTLTPYIDVDPQGGSWLFADQYKLTQAPLFDPFDPDSQTTTAATTTTEETDEDEETEETEESVGPAETTPTPAPGVTGAPSAAVTGVRRGPFRQRPPGPLRPTTTPGPTTTTAIVGYLLSSPYPYVPDMPDIPWTGSKFNGPWGFPLGIYPAFRGTGQYISHYNYYPLSYFGSALIPPRYRLSGR